MTDKPQLTLKDIEGAVTQLPILGTTLWWQLRGIRVQEADLKRALAGAGFEKHMPPLPTPRKALRRTLEAWIADKTRQKQGSAGAARARAEDDEETDDQKLRTLIRVINRPGAEQMVFALVQEDVDVTALGLSYLTDLRILLHKQTGQILCTTEARGVISAENESIQIAKELTPYWSMFRTLYFSEDLSRMVRSIITEMKAVSLRKEGGVYFVPAAEQPRVELLRSLIAALPTSGTEEPFLCVLAVPDVEAAKGQMARAVHYGFMDEIRAMAADLGRFVDAKPGTVRSETIAERLQSYRDVKAKVSMYATLLSMHQQDIVKELDGLTAKARTIVLGGKASASSPGTKKGLGGASSARERPPAAEPPPEEPPAENRRPAAHTAPGPPAVAGTNTTMRAAAAPQTTGSFRSDENPRLFV